LDNQFFTRFELEESGAPYADAEIIDRDTVSPDVRIYLVNENGQLHLLDFRSHFVTNRTALKRDIPVASDEDQHYKLGWAFNRADVEISQGRMKCDLLNGEYNPKLILSVYFLLAALLTAVESFFYRKIARVKWA